MNANCRSINDILNRARTLEIPFFQRSFVWDRENWERFVDDMEFVSDTNRPYFLGSVILKQKQSETGQGIGDHRIVIDGQQRLTTLCIFLKVLSLKLQVSYLDNIYRIEKDGSIAIEHNRNDAPSFLKVLSLQSLDNLPAKGEKDCRIYQAYTYFKDNINTKVLDPEKIKANLQFVTIDLAYEEDEQRIFDTINSLGVKLTTAELLKNYFFSKDDITFYEENWYSIFEANGQREYWDRAITTGRLTRSILDLFFYAFLQIKIQNPALNVNASDKNRFAKVEDLFTSYKSFIENYHKNKQGLIQEIKGYAELFRSNFDLDIVAKTVPPESGIERINLIIFGLENSTLIPYILFLLKNAEEDDRKQIYGYLESYVIRRMVSRVTNKNYNNLFGSTFILNNVTTLSALKTYTDSQTDINAMPLDKSIEDGFRSAVLTNRQAKHFLYMLETKLRDPGKHTTAMKSPNSYSLEHIMPKKWRNHWPIPATKPECDERDQKLLTLGNLTIISQALNASISDASWPQKKTGNKNDGLNAFAADLVTFSSDYLSKPEWDEGAIKERAEFLAKKSLEIWKM